MRDARRWVGAGCVALAAAVGSFAARAETFPPDRPPPDPAPATRPWDLSFTTEMRIKKGDFDTHVDTEISELAATLTAWRSRFDASLTLTYLEVETEGGGAAAVTAPAGRGAALGRKSASRAAAAGDEETESGPGDTYLDAGYLAWLQEDGFADLHLLAGMKIPTADEDDGLGTGERDTYLYATATRREAGLIGVGRVGRIFMGDSDTARFRDAWAFAAGFGRSFDTQEARDAEAILWLRGQTAAVQGTDDPVELAVTGAYPVRDRVFLRGEIAAGLTDSAPDYTLGVGVGIDF